MREEDKFALEIQLNNICKILGGEAVKSSCLNHLGESYEKITITYNHKKSG